MGSGYHRNFGAADQVRTGPKSLEGSCATTTPQPLNNAIYPPQFPVYITIFTEIKAVFSNLI